MMKFLLLITVLIFFSSPADCSQSKAGAKSIFRNDTVYRIFFSSGSDAYCSPEIVKVGNLSFLRVKSSTSGFPLLINLNNVTNIEELSFSSCDD